MKEKNEIIVIVIVVTIAAIIWAAGMFAWAFAADAKMMEEQRQQEIEHLYIIDATNGGTYHITDGNSTRLDYDITYLVTTAMSHGAKEIIIVHNHPGGYVVPSKDDLYWFNETRTEAKKYGVDVADSIIINSRGEIRSVWYE